jgi:hypothetical protein
LRSFFHGGGEPTVSFSPAEKNLERGKKTHAPEKETALQVLRSFTKTGNFNRDVLDVVC